MRCLGVEIQRIRSVRLDQNDFNFFESNKGLKPLDKFIYLTEKYAKSMYDLIDEDYSEGINTRDIFKSQYPLLFIANYVNKTRRDVELIMILFDYGDTEQNIMTAKLLVTYNHVGNVLRTEICTLRNSPSLRLLNTKN